MSNTQPNALRLADDLQSAVQTYPQMSEDEPGGYCRQEDQLMAEAAIELRHLHALNHEFLDALEKALYGLQYHTAQTGSLRLTNGAMQVVRAAIAKATGEAK